MRNTLRQNLKSADRFIPPASALARLCAFARHACLAAALATVAVALPVASAGVMPTEEQTPAGMSLEFNKAEGRLEIEWSGPIVAGMADDVQAAVSRYEQELKRVVLFLDVVRPCRFPGSWINRAVIGAAARSPFIRTMDKRHQEWQRRFDQKHAP